MRKFYEVHQATDSPIAAEALRRIAEPYTIETTICGQTPPARRARGKSLSLVNAMKVWLEETQLTHIPPHSGLADAIRYALTRWSALGLFLDDGRIELDNKTVERAIRPIALGRKNQCSPDPTAAPPAGRLSLRFWQPLSLTTSSRSPIHRKFRAKV